MLIDKILPQHDFYILNEYFFLMYNMIDVDSRMFSGNAKDWLTNVYTRISSGAVITTFFWLMETKKKKKIKTFFIIL